MAEEALIKRKLLLDGDGAGDDKKLNMLVRQISKWIHSDETPSEEEKSFNKLVAQLHALELDRKKFDLTNRCIANQRAKFKAIQATFQKRIDTITKDIERQQNLLERARVIKKNNVECELLVQAINQQPCRKELMQKIQILKKDIKELEQKRGNLDNKLNSKVKQCHVLSTSANAIKETLKDNDDWESSSNSETSEFDLQVTIN